MSDLMPLEDIDTLASEGIWDHVDRFPQLLDTARAAHKLAERTERLSAALRKLLDGPKARGSTMMEIMDSGDLDRQKLRAECRAVLEEKPADD